VSGSKRSCERARETDRAWWGIGAAMDRDRSWWRTSCVFICGWMACGIAAAAPADRPLFALRYAAELSNQPLDGRLLLLVSTNEEDEPRFQVSDSFRSQQVFGLDVEGWKSNVAQNFLGTEDGFPVRQLAQLPAGRYRVQALFHRYETFDRA